MPRGDGTGPYRQGAGTGRDMQRRGEGGRTGGNRPGSGPDGVCVCPSCGATIEHQRAVPCYTATCPKCGAQMIKE